MDYAKLQELMKQKKAALKQKQKTLKPENGTRRFVILPGWRKGDEHIYFHEFGMHFIKDAAGELKAIYPCLDATYGRPCPVCDGVAAAIRATTDDSMVKILEEAACGLKKQKYLLNVLALDSTDPDVPQILEVPKTVYKEIVELMGGWSESIFDPNEAQIITISRDGTGLLTKYSVQVSPKKHPIPKGVMAKLNNLDDYVAQENEEAARRAIGAINNVAGLLPAGSRDKPSISDDEDDAALNTAMSKATKSITPAIDDDLDSLIEELG